MNWVAILETPEFTLPAFLLGAASCAWAAWNVHDPPAGVIRSIARPTSDRDPISRAYYAFEAGRFSDVLERAENRLDQTSRLAFGRPVGRLPRTRWGARRLDPARPADALFLGRLGRRVAALRDLATRREAGVWIRLAFWRSHAQLTARFRAHLGPLLDEVALATAPAGSVP